MLNYGVTLLYLHDLSSMTQLLIWSAIAGILFFIFVFFIITGIYKKNRRRIFFSFLFLALSVVIGGWIVYNVITRSYHKVANALKPRSGMEMYAACLGNQPATASTS